MEQEEYKKEEIDWSYIEFVDNQDILDLIEKVFLYKSAILKLISFIFRCMVLYRIFIPAKYYVLNVDGCRSKCH
jgi:hypothetical protein